MSYELALQGELYEALNGAISCSVYDEAPQGSAFPYVTIGDTVAVEFDTVTTKGAYASFDVHVWSRKHGMKETKEILGEIYNALHQVKLTNAEYTFTECYFVQSTTMVDADGITRHGITEFKTIIEEI